MRAALGQAVRFGVVGVVNTLVGLAVIYLAMAALRFDDVAANVLGYAVGLAVGFALNRRWTFAHAGRVLPTALRFAVAFVVSYVLNLATMLLLRDHFGVDPYIAQAAGVPPYTIAFFLLSRYFVFRGPRRRGSARA